MSVSRKREVREYQRLIRKLRRSQRRREIKCFWTWPIGHGYEDMVNVDEETTAAVCVGCGRERDAIR